MSFDPKLHSPDEEMERDIVSAGCHSRYEYPVQYSRLGIVLAKESIKAHLAGKHAEGEWLASELDRLDFEDQMLRLGLAP